MLPDKLSRPVVRKHVGTPRADVGVPKAEAKLQRWLSSALARQPCEPGVQRIVCSELDVWHGIADLVVATTKKNGQGQMWLTPTALKKINLTTVKVLAQLTSRKYRDMADVSSASGLSQRTVHTHVFLLERLGIAKSTGTRVRLLKAITSPFSDITAYEIKVSDWKHGLYQATHYRAFANRVVLALPSKKAEAVASNKSVFRLFGIGLIGIESPSKLNWHIKPAKRKPISPSRALLGHVEIARKSGSKVLLTRGRP